MLRENDVQNHILQKYRRNGHFHLLLALDCRSLIRDNETQSQKQKGAHGNRNPTSNFV